MCSIWFSSASDSVSWLSRFLYSNSRDLSTWGSDGRNATISSGRGPLARNSMTSRQCGEVSERAGVDVFDVAKLTFGIL